MDNMDLVQILDMAYQKLTKEISSAYYNGRIDEVLKKYELEDETAGHFHYNYSNSKIIVIGESRVNKSDLEYIAKKNGIDPKKIEFELDYEKLTNYNFEKFKYNMSYSDVLIGPMPHKVKGLDESSSFLSMVREHPEDYPKIIELRDANELKITKQSFLNGLLETRLYNEI